MKKLFLIILSVITVFTFVACDKGVLERQPEQGNGYEDILSRPEAENELPLINFE